MFRQKEKLKMKKPQQQKKKKQQKQQQKKVKMSSPFAIPQVHKEDEEEDNDNDVSNTSLDNDVDHNDADGDRNENEKSRNLMLQTWQSLLLEKRQENEKLTTICNELNKRRDHLTNRKLQLLVAIITTQTPDADGREYNYLHWLSVENKNCINFMRLQFQNDKLKANAYLEQYDEYQKKLCERIVQNELFDEYTMMSHKEIVGAKEALTISTKQLQEQTDGNKLKGQEITKMAEKAYKNFIDEISTLESYENELINVKKQLKFEAEKPNFLKKRFLN